MFNSNLFFPVLASLTLTSCGVGSLNPAFPDSAADYDARLLGTWVSEDNESYVVRSDEAKGYTIIVLKANGDSSRFLGRIGRIGAHSVLDVQPDKSMLGTTDNDYTDLLLAMHTVLFLDSIGTEVRFRVIDPDSLKAFLGRNSSAVAHVNVQETTVLTATSSELQAFLARFVERPGVLGDPVVLSRKNRPPPNLRRRPCATASAAVVPDGNISSFGSDEDRSACTL